MKKTPWIIARLAVVLVFLLGMPLLAIPRIQEALGEVFAPEDQRLELPTDDSSQIELRTSDGLDSIVEPHPNATMAELQVVGGDVPQAISQPTEIEKRKQRLIDLGATYMVLERVGVDGSRYRFTCQLPVAAGSPYRRKLEAVDANPAEAMAKVQREIENEGEVLTDASELPRPTVKLR